MKFLKRETKEDSDQYLSEEEQLIEELKAAKIALDDAYSTFQHVTDPDLIDCAIYELKSVQMRYNFLHKECLRHIS